MEGVRDVVIRLFVNSLEFRWLLFGVGVSLVVKLFLINICELLILLMWVVNVGILELNFRRWFILCNIILSRLYFFVVVECLDVR